MKRLTACLVTVLALAGPLAVAAPEGDTDPETTAAVKRLMQVLRAEEQVGPMLASVQQMQDSMLSQQQLSEEEQATARELMAASMEEVEKMLSWENLQTVMVSAYASVFTREEIDDLTALFETPAGQRYIEKQPELQAATMREMGTIMMNVMPQIQKKTQEVLERIKTEASED